MDKTVISIGELLWDIFNEEKIPGGSSMNVALNLHKQGLNSKLISAVGNDNYGRELIDYLAEKQFPTDLIQVNETLATSTVVVALDERQQASYTINYPVAWDAIKLNDKAIQAVKHADVFIYCSLTCRDDRSKKTILALLKEAKLKVFDLNLRAPFYTLGTLSLLLNEANIIKVNVEELLYLKTHLALTGNTNEQLLRQLMTKFNYMMICLTLGEQGAYILHEDRLYTHKGYSVRVADTVGAGDAFLATFIAGYLEGYPIETILDRSCKVGAFIASQKGANPAYDNRIFDQQVD